MDSSPRALAAKDRGARDRMSRLRNAYLVPKDQSINCSLTFIIGPYTNRIVGMNNMDNYAMGNADQNRRPIKTRAAAWPNQLAMLLGRIGMKPNSVSVLSSVNAAAAAALMYFSVAAVPPVGPILLLLAALFIQFRLLCNLLDGLLAVEGGKKSAVGELFNEFPDRISDTLILVGAGYAAGYGNSGISLGWACAVLALGTAYVRAFGAHCTGKQDFSGPMAKQHRMAVLTIALACSAALTLFTAHNFALMVALIIIAVGSAITCVRRTMRLAAQLKEKS